MTIKILQKNNNLETHVRGQFLSYKMVKYDKNFNFIEHIVNRGNVVPPYPLLPPPSLLKGKVRKTVGFLKGNVVPPKKLI